MEAVFSGLVLIWYVISRYVGEWVFILAVTTPLLFTLCVTLVPFLGVYGKAYRCGGRARRMVRAAGVITPENRDLFFKRCIKPLPLYFQNAYFAFIKDEIKVMELSQLMKPLYKGRKQLVLGAFGALCGFLIAAVVLCFYFTVSTDELVFRCALPSSMFFAGRLLMLLSIYGYEAAGRRGMAKLAETLDKCFVRRDAGEKESVGKTYAENDEDGNIERLINILKDVDGGVLQGAKNM